MPQSLPRLFIYILIVTYISLLAMNVITKVFVFISFCNLSWAFSRKLNVNYMELGSEVHYAPNGELGFQHTDLRIYCYRGKPKNLIYMWQTVSLKLKISNDNFDQYEGFTPENVYDEYQEHRKSWSFSIFSNKKKTNHHLNPFNQSCIGIDAAQKYSVHLSFVRVDFWKLVLLGTGVVLFFSANKLSNNTFFFYICGIAFGICASFLILVYLISKLLPKRPAMIGFMVGGWTVGLYLVQVMWENIRVIADNYKTHLMWYIFITGFISFVICYRIGPIKNPRSKNIIQWTLQIVGILSVALHSDYQEAAISICIFMVLIKYFPKKVVDSSHKYWRQKFPPKPKLITSEEYYEEGVRETCKALQGLREYCNSPECKQWRTMLKLKNSKRFASFIEGSSHLTDEEILDYESPTRLYRKTKRSARTMTESDSDMSEDEPLTVTRNGNINITDDSSSDEL